MTAAGKPSTGVRAFAVIWAGQLVSVLASAMTSFALTIWMYQQTQSATAMALMQVALTTPFLLLAPFVGVMVDRYDRKRMMMVGDMLGGLASLIGLTLFVSGHLTYWYLYVAAFLNGVGNAFQQTVYPAVIGSLVPKEHLGRANGVLSMAETGGWVIAPMLAGLLLGLIGLGGILVIDVATFLFALWTLARAFIPQPLRAEDGLPATGSMLREAAFGFAYLWARPSLRGLEAVFFVGNLFVGIGLSIIAPLILARTHQDSLAYGSVGTAFGVGSFAGCLLMSAWGGFRRQMYGVLLGWSFLGLFLMVLFGFGQGVIWWMVCGGLGMMVMPVISGSMKAIQQAKVAPELQGRVFSASRVLSMMTQPVAPIIGGTLADFVLEPAMANPASALARVFGGLFGSGPGAGMGLLLTLCGIGAALVGLGGYLVPAIREVDTLLPDHGKIMNTDSK